MTELLQLNDQCGYLFRAGSIIVDCSVVIPKTVNCDVPYLAAYTDNQKLTATKDPEAKRKSLPDGHFKMQSIEFGIFDGDFPSQLKMRYVQLPSFAGGAHAAFGV
jgi:hypothetical protein